MDIECVLMVTSKKKFENFALLKNSFGKRIIYHKIPCVWKEFVKKSCFGLV